MWPLIFVLAVWPRLAVLWVPSSSDPDGREPQPAPQAMAAQHPVVVDGRPITEDELARAMIGGRARLEDQAAALRQQTIDQLIEQRLLDAEAKRRGLTINALIQAEVDAKVAEPTELELEQFARNNGRSVAADSTLRPVVRRALLRRRASNRRKEWLASLRARAHIEMGAPPTRPVALRATINTESAPVRGPERAMVTIIEFSDFECPYCRRSQPMLDALLKRYPSQVRHVFRHFPLDDLHPTARRAAKAAWCAQQQGQFWPVHHRLFETPPDQLASIIDTLGTEQGLDPERLRACVKSDAAKRAVQDDVEQGTRVGIAGTPMFFVNGRVLGGSQSIERFIAVIEEELRLGPSAAPVTPR